MLPAAMRALLLTGHGGFDKLVLRDDVPLPVPGPDDVLIRVRAAAVNNTDINTRIGWYSKAVAGATSSGTDAGMAGAQDDGWSGAPFHFPRIQGADACGSVVAVGAHVSPNRIGERILVEPYFRGAAPGEARYFGSEVDGAFADFAIVPSVHAHRIESALGDTELASFPCAYSAAENMLARIGVSAGEHVLVTGASGGVGSAAVQLARRRGARIVAMAGEDKATLLHDLGAEQVIARDADIIALFGTEAFDAVVDVVGGAGFGSLILALKRGGRYAVAGAIAGPIVSLDLRSLYLKDLRLAGCTQLTPDVFPNLVRYIERGEIRPLVAETFKLDEIVTAQSLFLSKRHVGKIVIEI
jgi:NADPH:quinone reductase-like Zn-dependent oxidoreductase